MIPGRKYSDAEIKDARARFERANKEFDKVLEHLDREISETLRNYWKRQSERAPFILASLEMAQLLGHWAKWAGTIGFAFYFHEVLVREAPDSVFHIVIAHELAHALQMARENVFFLELVANPERMAAHERTAARLTEEWGFNQLAANAWCEKHIG